MNHPQEKAPELRVSRFEKEVEDRSIPKRKALLLESYKNDRIHATSPGRGSRAYIMREKQPPSSPETVRAEGRVGGLATWAAWVSGSTIAPCFAPLLTYVAFRIPWAAAHCWHGRRRARGRRRLARRPLSLLCGIGNSPPPAPRARHASGAQTTQICTRTREPYRPHGVPGGGRPTELSSCNNESCAFCPPYLSSHRTAPRR